MDIIFDIDGTLMDIEHRRHFVEGKKKNWNKFIEHMKYDIPNKPIASILQSLCDRDARLYNNIFFFTGRNEAERWITIEHIERCGYDHQGIADSPKDDYERLYYKGGHYDEVLFMRADNDNRPDVEVKSEMLDKLIEQGHNPVLVFDDRQSVVDMWRARGLLCCQVADGDF